MNAQTQSSFLDIDSLLDGTLDDIADMPEFKPFAAGAHVCTLKVEQKTIGDTKAPAFEVTLTVVETQELANPEKDEAPKPGDSTNVLYMMNNELGQGSFKKLLAAAAESFGPKKNRELIDDLQGAEALVVTKVRMNKDKTKSYTDIVSLQIV